MNEELIDKSILYIDSKNATIDTKELNINYNIDLAEPIKNVLYIALLKSNIVLTDPLNAINNVAIEDSDPIYINLNDYHRLSANNNTYKYFEKIDLNLTDKFNYISFRDTPLLSFYIPRVCSFTNEYIPTSNPNDSQMFVLNPIEPNLRKINIKVYDKNHNILKKSDIVRVSLTLCVFYNRKKFTMN